MDILLVGCGKMGSALSSRWREKRICRNLVIVDPVSGDVKSAADIPAGFFPQAIVFAVKPQTLPGVIGDYKKFDAPVISIAAGTSISFFEEHLGADKKIIRCMPNTPAAIGRGVTVAFANKNAGAAEKDAAAALLGAVGEVLWAEKESLLNPVTALSGSGPAYVFLLIEALAHAGVKSGLDPALAEKLARQTVIGSAALAKAGAGTSAATLRENVTSPGGTTEAALRVLMAEEKGLQELFDRALAAATKRAEELARL